MALALGASCVFASKVSPARLYLVRECAADAIIFNPREIDPMTLIMEETSGRGVEVVLEYSGNQDALRSAFRVLRLRKTGIIERWFYMVRRPHSTEQIISKLGVFQVQLRNSL